MRQSNKRLSNLQLSRVFQSIVPLPSRSVSEIHKQGYTALHLAMQFDHENIFNLLIQVYGANQEIRDHSGKKARQYVASQEAAVSQDTFRRIIADTAYRQVKTQNSPFVLKIVQNLAGSYSIFELEKKDLGFLRIGSLNVRVKRTTEAFSQFLGVATSANTNHEKIHKTWGSADNIQEHKIMPPPRYAPIKKRRSKKAQDFLSSRGHIAVSQPSTPLPQTKDLTHKNTKSFNRRPSSTTAILPIASSIISHDSDSDGACGFDSAWRGSAQL
ncbi:hypothetical protein PV326_000301 [Microctonus aethiopoides]|nr:hypothetical protein PV326_000301 [Microctonus aethiopoides]